MHAEPSLLDYFWQASWIVKAVMVLLLAASILSWTFIFQQIRLLRKAKRDLVTFEDKFWSGIDLNRLFTSLDKQTEQLTGVAHIFHAGFQEYQRLRNKPITDPDKVLAGVQRAMNIAQARESDRLEKHLSFLATVGSTSPYIGLFGTVWGILTSFHALGQVQQATIAMVAPGISEALVATAIGLFAAIPAVIAYNRFNHDVGKLLTHYAIFHEEFSNILYREIQAISEPHA